MMNYYLAVFRSQTQTYAFMQLLSSYKVPAMVIQTPRQAQVSCGLSVKFFGDGALEFARQILSRRQMSSFVAFFFVEDFGEGRKQIKQI